MQNKEFDIRSFLYKNPLLENEDKEEKEEHEEGAIADDRDHIDALDADAEADEKKLKKDKSKDVKESALRKAIQNEITSILREAEEVEVEDEEDVDIDIKDEVDIDDESTESKMEVDSELAGEDADTAGVLGLLTKAQSEAEALGDEKLMDQIGNTITYFTRAHVVKSTQTRAVAEEEEVNEFLGFGKKKKSSGGSSDIYDVFGHTEGGNSHSLGSGYESEQEAKDKSRKKRRQFQKNFKVDSPAFSITKNNKTVWSI